MPGFETIGAEEFAEVSDVFNRGGVLFRHGFDGIRQECYKVRDFERAFAEYMQVPHALAVTSGTAALRVALASLGIGRGDEVISPSFTFVATVEAVVESGATPICCEVDKTLNVDPADLERRITDRTKAVIVVHMLGMPARLHEIRAICDARGITLIEDTAWGCGGKLGGRFLGTHGAIGTFSFDFAKAMTTGEGGMVVFQDQETYARAAAWHDHGHENNPALPRWEDSRSSSGFNYRMMELQGAVGLAQLKKLPGVLASHRANRAAMAEALEGLPGIEMRHTPEGSEDTCDALVFLVENRETAIACRNALLETGVSTKILPEAFTWHFAGTWHHITELKQAHGGDLAAAFPASTDLLGRAVSLPIVINMAEGTPAKVRAALQTVLR